ncbi:MAG: restriction endonuclease subunit S [Anaerolinea sp.]|nr:restriction endonuclease subunit S [Anaerolinea sp.]
MTPLPPYPAYKDSGVPWLGRIPAHWDATMTKRHYSIQLGKMLQNTPKSNDDKSIPYLKAQHVQWFAVRSHGLPHMWASPVEIEGYGVQVGDLLVCEGGEGGRSGLVKSIGGPAIIQNALHRVRPSSFCRNDFLQYVMSTVSAIGWFDALNNKATIAHFTYEKFGALGIPIPPPHEQRAITRYLDHVDRRIRRTIRARQKLIALLEEQKQAVIHLAVTGQIDVRTGRPYPVYKPSGVEWLGEVPEHWDTRPAKYFFREVDERSLTGEEELLSVSHITGVTPRNQKTITMFMAASYVGHKRCQPGDLVINTMWAWMGALGIAEQTGLVSPSYGVYRPLHSSTLLPEYADCLLRTKPFVDEYICRSTGIRSSRLRLYPEQFLRIHVVCPSAEEQRSILDQIATGTGYLNAAIDRTQREIALLREYRTRLIADVVTGQVDVRAAAAQLPAEVEETDALVEEEVFGDEEGEEQPDVEKEADA